ncbi:MAG TPA: tripartite tricarboxylate transporter substrate-binding protein [Burkholderiales bacterium]|nr:tripartite tricarboxylate transporter substrate-binding protein [Burkholderiales bacterium]
MTALLAMLCLVAAGAVQAAESYPTRPIRMIVPFAAGGTVTVVAHTIAGEAQRHLGQQFVIDSRPGANGIVGTQLVVNANPDGYTVLATSVSIAINPAIYKKLPYDTLKDLTPVTVLALGSTGYLLLANPSSAARSVKDILALAKGTGKPLTYASGGVGNGTHLIAELFSRAAGINLTHVPYKGVAPALNAALGGEVDLTFVPPSAAVAHVKAGTLRAIGFTGPSRWAVLPNVPTIAEAGLPGFQREAGWLPWLVPAKTPKDVIAKLHAAAHKAVHAPKVREILELGGYTPLASPPDEARKFMRSQIDLFADIIRTVGIQPE